MSDIPTPAAQSLYPDLPSAADRIPAPPAEQASPAARALFGDGGKKIARPVDGKSPLGGEARPSTEPEPAIRDRMASPRPQQQQAARSEPFNPAKLQVEGMEAADPALMREFSTTAKELGLNHAGAEKLVQLHAKVQRQADAAMERQSDAWLSETMETIPNIRSRPRRAWCAMRR
jgi:hypothetical protein